MSIEGGKTLNQWVVGSSPTRDTNEYKGLQEIVVFFNALKT